MQSPGGAIPTKQSQKLMETPVSMIGNIAKNPIAVRFSFIYQLKRFLADKRWGEPVGFDSTTTRTDHQDSQQFTNFQSNVEYGKVR